MKFFHATIFAVMLAFMGAPMVRAQQPEEKPKQQEEKKPPPAAKEKEKPAPDERAKPEKSKQEPDKAKPQKEKEKAPAQQRQSTATERNQGATAQRGSHKNARSIPPERFQASFGREHHFRVQRRDDRHFEQGGFVFEVVEVFPAWAFDDDCFIEEDGDDYYLVDVVHPELRVLVVIVS